MKKEGLSIKKNNILALVKTKRYTNSEDIRATESRKIYDLARLVKAMKCKTRGS